MDVEQLMTILATKSNYGNLEDLKIFKAVKNLQDNLTAAESETKNWKNYYSDLVESCDQLRAQLAEQTTPAESVQGLCFHNTGEDSSKHYTSYAPPIKTVRDIDAMVSKFLGWKLPEDFSPDCGISFVHNEFWGKYPNNWPIGTNLFTATQAKAMIQNILSAPPKVEQVSGGGEPVAEITRAFCDSGYFFTVSWLTSKFKEGDKLYLHPSPNKADVHWMPIETLPKEKPDKIVMAFADFTDEPKGVEFCTVASLEGFGQFTFWAEPINFPVGAGEWCKCEFCRPLSEHFDSLPPLKDE